MKAIIISGGNPPTEEILKEEMKNTDIIICADSGANCLYKLGIIPDYLIGDFDSIDKNVLKYYKTTGTVIEKYNCEKDFTDTEAGFKIAISLGTDEIAFLGCTGSRFDHFFGNLGLLHTCLINNVKGYIRDSNNIIFLANSQIKLKGKRKQIFSIQAFGETVHNLSIKKAKYELLNFNLNFGEPRTVSNEFLDTDVIIDFSEGIIIIFMSND